MKNQISNAARSFRLLAAACLLAPGIGAGATLAHSSADAAAECGRISIFDNAPRQQDLHAATIISIDGRAPGTAGQDVYRVAAGPHVLEVSERIDDRYLGFSDRLRGAGKTYKELHVDVAPDTTYSLAAHLNEAQRSNWKDGAYWEPVIWNETPESCG
jgi:hypothetical protein